MKNTISKEEIAFLKGRMNKEEREAFYKRIEEVINSKEFIDRIFKRASQS